jgi:hypothetical protein
MASKIRMVNPTTGIVKQGFYGFSWTTFFFGMFPALFRGDFLTFIGGVVVVVIVAFATAGVGAWIAMVIWAFFYNSYYTKKLLEKGYGFDASLEETRNAKSALGIADVQTTQER